MTRAPQAITKLWNDIDKAIPAALLGGIVGDSRHNHGYHLSRNSVTHGDYSVQLRRDRGGASDCASALDVTLPPALMKTCTRRLLAAAIGRDKRLGALREFCGTLDGHNTYPWDLPTNSSEGLNSWDDSHLFHIHLSFFRDSADNYTALAPIAEVLAGVEYRPKPPPTLLEEIVALDRNSADYKQLVADIAHASAGEVWRAQLTREKVTWPAMAWLVSAYTEAKWAREGKRDGDGASGQVTHK